MVYPTKEQFRDYSGENISGKLAGDIKEQERLWAILCDRCYEIITDHLVGIRETDLTDDDLVKWHKLIMEQAEYLLSLGDNSLIDGSIEISPRIERMASKYRLWSFRIC
jgi:hypothetical protein